MRVVIAFDISNNQVRYRVVKELKSKSRRVQKSIFESAQMSKSSFLRLRSKCEGLIDPKTDSLRYYTLCAKCSKLIEHFGIGPGHIVLPQSFEIID